MDKTKLDHLDEAIRHSIEEECSNRNSRTNWFLVLQVALVGGIIQVCSNDFSEQYRWIFVIIIGIVGFLISVSFAFAAWRSEKAVDMLLAFWDQVREENKMGIADNYPVIPLTSGIIKDYFRFGCYVSFDKSKDTIWQCKLAMRMKLTCIDMLINKCAGLMPYKFIPKLFLVCWLLLLLFVVICNHGKVICG